MRHNSHTQPTLPFSHCLADTYFTEKPLNGQAANVTSEAQILHVHTAIFLTWTSAKCEGEHPLNETTTSHSSASSTIALSWKTCFKNNSKLVSVFLSTGHNPTQELKPGLEDKFFNQLSEIFYLHQTNLTLLAEGGELFPFLLSK